MKLNTEVTIEGDFPKLTLEKSLLVLGSCFSEHIGNKLKAIKMSVTLNPTGILYNPFSIAEALYAIDESRTYTEQDLFFAADEWHSWDHHSAFSNADSAVCLDRINRSLQEAHTRLEPDVVFFITFGTAFVYRLRSTGRIVANCHKMPDSYFVRQRATVEEIVACYDRLISQIQTHFSGASFIFTVSPIRHWKDGAHENQLSKAILLLAIDALKIRHTNVCYFPSYEIVMDELRDYRFYADDMLHIAPIAIEYIWEKFRESMLHPSVNLFQQKYDKLFNAMQHRPFRPNSDGYHRFLQQHLDYLERLSETYPFLSFDEERAFFVERLQK